MGPRNMLILFFSTLCVSLVLLIILFSFGFKDVDMEFNTKLPEQAPDLGDIYKEEGKPGNSRADGVTSATVRVPQAGGAHPLESLTGSSPTEDIAPELQDDTEEAKKAPLPETKKEDAKKDTGPENPATLPNAPVPDLKPLVSDQKKSDQKAESKKEDPAPPTATYQVYLDGFTSRESAQQAAEKISGSGAQPFVRGTGSGFIVQVGVFSSKDNADAMAGKTGAKVRKL